MRLEESEYCAGTAYRQHSHHNFTLRCDQRSKKTMIKRAGTLFGRPQVIYHHYSRDFPFMEAQQLLLLSKLWKEFSEEGLGNGFNGNGHHYSRTITKELPKADGRSD